MTAEAFLEQSKIMERAMEMKESRSGRKEEKEAALLDLEKEKHAAAMGDRERVVEREKREGERADMAAKAGLASPKTAVMKEVLQAKKENPEMDVEELKTAFGYYDLF